MGSRRRVLSLRQCDPRYDTAYRGHGLDDVTHVQVLSYTRASATEVAAVLTRQTWGMHVLPSPRAVEVFAAAVLQLSEDTVAQSVVSVPVAVVGAHSAALLRRLLAGYPSLVVIGEAAGTGLKLADIILAYHHSHRLSHSVLLLCGSKSLDTLPTALTAAGMTVERAVVYQSVVRPDFLAHVTRLLDASLGSATIDQTVIVVFSPSGIAPLTHHLSADAKRRIAVVCIGPTTAAAARAAGFSTLCVAQDPTPEAIAALAASAKITCRNHARRSLVACRPWSLARCPVMTQAGRWQRLSQLLRHQELCGSQSRAMGSLLEGTLMQQAPRRIGTGPAAISLAVNSDSTLLATTHTGDHVVRIWSTSGTQRHALVAELKQHAHTAWSVAWHPVWANVVVSAGRDQLVVLWALYRGQDGRMHGRILAEKTFPAWVDTLAWHAAGRLLAIGLRGRVYMWPVGVVVDAASPLPKLGSVPRAMLVLNVGDHHLRTLRSVLFHPRYPLVLTASLTAVQHVRRVALYAIANPGTGALDTSPLLTIPSVVLHSETGCAFSRCGRWLAVIVNVRSGNGNGVIASSGSEELGIRSADALWPIHMRSLSNGTGSIDDSPAEAGPMPDIALGAGADVLHQQQQRRGEAEAIGATPAAAERGAGVFYPRSDAAAARHPRRLWEGPKHVLQVRELTSFSNGSRAQLSCRIVASVTLPRDFFVPSLSSVTSLSFSPSGEHIMLAYQLPSHGVPLPPLDCNIPMLRFVHWRSGEIRDVPGQANLNSAVWLRGHGQGYACITMQGEVQLTQPFVERAPMR